MRNSFLDRYYPWVLTLTLPKYKTQKRKIWQHRSWTEPARFENFFILNDTSIKNSDAHYFFFPSTNRGGSKYFRRGRSRNFTSSAKICSMFLPGTSHTFSKAAGNHLISDQTILTNCTYTVRHACKGRR